MTYRYHQIQVTKIAINTLTILGIILPILIAASSYLQSIIPAQQDSDLSIAILIAETFTSAGVLLSILATVSLSIVNFKKSHFIRFSVIAFIILFALLSIIGGATGGYQNANYSDTQAIKDGLAATELEALTIIARAFVLAIIGLMAGLSIQFYKIHKANILGREARARLIIAFLTILITLLSVVPTYINSTHPADVSCPVGNSCSYRN